MNNNIEWLSKHETWRDIAGYEGLYQVSSFGRVRGLDRVVTTKNGRRKTVKGRIMKMGDNGNGYVIVVLRKNNIPHTYYVHRLVARAFLANTKNYPEINHKDEVKSHNNIINLEWCDRTYNNTYGTKIERTTAHHDYIKGMKTLYSPESRKKATISRSRLINVYNRETGKYYGSGFAKYLSSILGLGRATITSYANGGGQSRALLMKYNDEDLREHTFTLKEFPKDLSPKQLRMYDRNSNVSSLKEMEIVCYDSLSRQLEVFCSISEASKKTCVPSYKIHNSLSLSGQAKGTKRYVFVRRVGDYMKDLALKYQKMKNKPINVYSSDGKFMFRDFNYNLADYFEVSVDYINRAARGICNNVKGCFLEKALFLPLNTLEDR